MASKTETLDLCQRKPCFAMRQGGILLWILEFIAQIIMMRQVYSNVLFYLEIVNKMRQVSITISEFTHSIKQPCGRCNIMFIW